MLRACVSLGRISSFQEVALSDKPNYFRGNRVNISLYPETQTLLRQLASQQHQGNASATIAAALEAYATMNDQRSNLIRQAVLELAAAAEPDERYDPAEDNRAEQPHLLLASLLDDQAAQAIGSALRELSRRRLRGGFDGRS